MSPMTDPIRRFGAPDAASVSNDLLGVMAILAASALTYGIAAGL